MYEIPDLAVPLVAFELALEGSLMLVMLLTSWLEYTAFTIL